MFGNLHVIESKSEVDPELMKLFRATERRIRWTDDPELAPTLRHHYSEEDEAGEDHARQRLIYYEADANSVRDRLDLFGYTIDAARRLFDEWRLLEISSKVLGSHSIWTGARGQNSASSGPDA